MASYSEIHGSERAKSMPGYSFGVRSYLHYFYEECTASVWDKEDIQNQRSYQWWSSGLCKVGKFYMCGVSDFRGKNNFLNYYYSFFITRSCIRTDVLILFLIHPYRIPFPSSPGGISFSILGYSDHRFR